MTHIDIDFVAGTHGNFLEFVLNKLVLGSERMLQDLPFDQSGASHEKLLPFDEKMFHCGHWSTQHGGCTGSRVIAIRFGIRDLLPVMSRMFVIAGE